MFTGNDPFRYLLSISMVFGLGLFLGFFLFRLFGVGLSFFRASIFDLDQDVRSIGVKEVELGGSNFRGKFVPKKSGKTIHIDTYSKIVSLYEDGLPIELFRVSSFAPSSTPWFLVSGEFKVLRKEREHKSYTTGVLTKNNIIFDGNYSIYSLTEYESQKETEVGSILLNENDAKKTFDFADLATSVIVSTDVSEVALEEKDKYFLGLTMPSFEVTTARLPLKAKGFLVEDLSGGRTLISQAADKKFPIASVTKLMTAIVSLDVLSPSDYVMVSRGAVSTYGSQGGLRAGDKLRVLDLIFCLLLESSNDAAEVLAEKYGRKNFISLMNKKAEELRMVNTFFKDPSGLSSSNVSTAEDLGRLVAYISTSRSDILAITEKKTHEAFDASSKRYFWINRNRLIRDNNVYYSGGKDGFTGDALMTFSGLFTFPVSEFDDKKFIVTLLKSTDRNSDIQKVLGLLLNSFKYKDGVSLNEIIDKRKKSFVGVEPINNLSLMLVGDMMLDRGVRQMVNSHGGGNYLFSFEKVLFIKDADIAFGNLEGPVSDLGYDLGGKYSFRMDPLVLSALSEVGFDALSIANNHIGDFGLAAFEDTIKRLGAKNILYVGGGLNDTDARSVKIIEKNGIRIGFLGFSDVGPEWLSRNNGLPKILLANDPSLETIVSEAARTVDHLVVSFHFGDEYKKEPTERQYYLAHKAIDAGARVVVGHHPHLVQSVENYKDGVIAYSLGNFIFDQGFSDETMEGSILEVIFDKTRILQVNQNATRLNSWFQPALTSPED